MSFGIGIGDFLAVYDKAKAIVDACRGGPPEFRELSREVESLQITTKGLMNDRNNPESILNRKGHGRERDLKQIIDNCDEALKEMQSFVDKHSAIEEQSEGLAAVRVVKRIWHSYKAGSEDLDNMRGKLNFHTSCIGLFLDSLSTAALGRIEQKIDLIVAKLMIANPAESTASLASIHSVFSFVDPKPNEDAWTELRTALLSAGVSANDIEDHKSRIITYIKGIVTDSLSQLEIEEHSDPTTTQSNQGEIAQRQKLLTTSELLALRFQKNIGKASVSFKIHRVQYGTYAAHPACLLVTDFWFNSTDEYQLIAGYIFLSVRYKGIKESKSSTFSIDSPHIVKFAPETQTGGPIDKHKGYSTSMRFESSFGGVANVVGVGVSGRHEYTTIKTFHFSLLGAAKPGNRRVEWQVKGNSECGLPLNRLIRTAVIIEHGMLPFYVDIERSGSLRSGLRKLMTIGVRNEIESIPFQPESNESVLEEINLEELVFPSKTEIQDADWSI